MLHIYLGELPEPVEFLLLVHLNSHHHSVGHALCPHIGIAGIHDIALIITHGMVDSDIGRAVE
ncbi:hypothetical protein D3C73_1328980 [compost metagenome]